MAVVRVVRVEVPAATQVTVALPGGIDGGTAGTPGSGDDGGGVGDPDAAAAVVVSRPSVALAVRAAVEGPQGPRGQRPVTYPGGALLDPREGDQLDLGRLRAGETVTQVRAVVRGDEVATVTLELRYALNRSDAGTVFVAPVVVVDRGAGQELALVTDEIPEGAWVWGVIGTTTGSPDGVVISLET